MHLKILIGVLTLGLVSATPKAAAKPAAKATPQDFTNGQFYVPTNNFGQNFAAQSYQGQPPLVYPNVRYSPENYGHSSGHPIGVPAYHQASSGNYYQQPQLIPVPVAYSNGQNNYVYNGYNSAGARLWPKTSVSPTGSPSPVTASPNPLYYPSSTPNPVAYQTSGNYVNSPFVRNFQIPVSTPAPVQAQYQQLIPVPVKVSSRNSFQPEVTNYNTASQSTTVSPPQYFPNYQQQSTPSSFIQQTYQQPTAIPYAAYQQQAAGASYVGQYQQPTAAPYQVSYYQQQSTPAPYQINYQQQPYSYQQSTVSPFAAYNQQPTATPYVAQYQQPAANYYTTKYQQPLASAFPVNYQRIPVPVGYPQNLIQPQPTKPTLTYAVTPTASYPSISVKSKPITVVPTSPAPTKTVTITEKPYVPIHTTPTPISKPKATIIKSEYNSGTVSPQYNLIPSYSTTSPFAYAANQYLPHSVGNPATYGVSYAPSKSFGYSPSTAVSHVNYSGLGTSYSYKK